MTKVQLPFTLSVPLDGVGLSRIADLYEIYGILRISAEPGERKLTVEYDATRFYAARDRGSSGRSRHPLSLNPSLKIKNRQSR